MAVFDKIHEVVDRAEGLGDHREESIQEEHNPLLGENIPEPLVEEEEVPLEENRRQEGVDAVLEDVLPEVVFPVELSYNHREAAEVPQMEDNQFLQVEGDKEVEC